MDTMKRAFLSGICVLLFSVAMAQIDDSRMQRDLEISKNILSSLLKEEGNRMISGRSIDASYVEGFGVIVKLPVNSFAFNYHFNVNTPNVVIADIPEPLPFGDNDIDVRVMHDADVQVQLEEIRELMEDEREEIEEQREALEEEREALEEERQALEEEGRKAERDSRRVVTRSYSYHTPHVVGYGTMDMEEQNARLEELLITFLSDYADLIGQLRPDEKIMITQEGKNESMAMIWTSDNGRDEIRKLGGTGLSITATKKDITAVKTEKIDREEFVNRLDIKRGEPKERIADLEIFGNVFQQYFSPEYSKTFFTDRKPDYERLEGLGAIYSIKTYSSFLENDRYLFPASGKEPVSEKERKEKIEAMYPQFISDIKAFVVDYGRTIRSLGANEKLVLNIKLTNCETCAIPKYVEVSVPVSQLSGYDQQKITREKAIESVTVKEKE